MRGSKITPKKQAEIIKMKLNNPEVTQTEIEKRTGVPDTTVSSVLEKYFGKVGNGDELIKAIVNQDAQNIALGTILVEKEFVRRIDDAEQGRPAEIKEVAAIMADATKRHQLLTGGATENVGMKVQTFLPEKDE